MLVHPMLTTRLLTNIFEISFNFEKGIALRFPFLSIQTCHVVDNDIYAMKFSN